MDPANLAFLFVAMLLLAFTLGATIAWRLEGRRPLVAPLWLIGARNLSAIAWVGYVVVTVEPPTGFVSVDPLWWNVVEGASLVGSVAVMVLDLRHTLRDGQAT